MRRGGERKREGEGVGETEKRVEEELPKREGEEGGLQKVREGSPAMELRWEKEEDLQKKREIVREDEEQRDRERGAEAGKEGRKSGGWWRWLPVKRVTTKEIEERLERNRENEGETHN